MSLMFQTLKPSDQYHPNWLDRRRRTRLTWSTLIAGGLVAAVTGGILDAAFGRSQWHFVWVASAWVGAFLVARVRQIRWPCPRCGRPFHVDGILYRPFTTNCLHCGLPDHAPSGDD